MSVTPVTTDILPSNVPKLDMKGTNWAIFAFRFQVAVEAKDLWGHLDGSTACPKYPDPMSTDQKTEVNKWVKDEWMAKYLLAQRIPDSTALRVQKKATVADMWKEISKEYTEKGVYAQTDLHTQFLKSRLAKGVDVCQFLDGLWTKKEELAAVGVSIDDTDFRLMIIKSLPNPRANFTSSQLTAARLFTTAKTLEPDVLISVIAEEVDHQKVKYPMRGDTKDRDRDEAMAVAHGGPSRGRGRGGQGCRGNGRRNPPKCWECRSTDHLAAFHKKTGSEKKPTSTNTANAAEADSDSEDGVFGVLEDSSDDESVPGLLSAEPSDDEEEEGDSEDWFSVTDEDVFDDVWDLEESQALNVEDMVSIDCAAPVDDLENVAMEIKEGHTPSCQVKLYNSGTMRHISPYCERFENLIDIPDKFFTAANHQKFVTTGVGDMIVEVPNGYDVSKLHLTEVLFSLEVGYTLESIGCLDELGLSTTFAEGFCTIKGSDGETIGRIPRTSKGLYRVVHEHETANAATETVTVMELHRRYGHIAPSVAHHLVENGLVSGLKFDDTKDGGTFCKSCIYVKATRKPIMKICEGEWSKEVGMLVWSDVWGPVPVETLGGKQYYITFTDDHSRLTYLWMLRQKSETFAAYQQFKAWLDRQLAAKVCMLHSDRGGEYLGNEFIMYLKRQGMAQRLTAHDTPQHNGIAE